MRNATWGQIWPQVGKTEILEKRLSPTAQNHYADLEDTCRDKVTKVGVIVTYTKNVIEKNEGWGQIWPRVAVWGLNLSPYNPSYLWTYVDKPSVTGASKPNKQPY